MPAPAAMSGYLEANRSAAVADRSARVRIEASGPDRAKVLHNLTTNDIKRLAAGRGAEAFLSSGQGKTLAFLQVHAEADRLLVRADPGTAEAILAHVRKFGLFDDAAFDDVSAETVEWHVAGPSSADLARSLALDLPPADLAISGATLAGCPVRLILESPTGRPGFTIIAGKADEAAILGTLGTSVARLEPDAFEAMRIEAGTPVFGRDAMPTNLPQEVNRDSRAISFVKGCYLGQETVARLDALGHVNKILFGAIADDDRVPPAGSTLEVDGKEIGVVTSSSNSPGWSRGVVLGYAKVAHVAPGTRLTAVSGADRIGLTVKPWPILPG